MTCSVSPCHRAGRWSRPRTTTTHCHSPPTLFDISKHVGFFFENLNSFSSGARLKSIWLVVEKIWNVSNISPNPWLWLPAAGPLSPSWAGTAFCFSSAQICSVLCYAPLPNWENIQHFQHFQLPPPCILVTGVIRRLQTQPAGSGWLQSMSLLFLPIPHLDRGSHFQLLRPHLDCDSVHCPCRGR